jgi:GcrA cell cycle regulator
MEWNDARIAELTKKWQAGFSASQVAKHLGGVTRSAVIGKVHRLGISGRSCPSRPGSGGRPARVARVSPGGARREVAPRAPRSTPSMTVETFPTATVLTLTEDSCRWPIGDPNQAEFGFCGRGRAGKGPYCLGHGPMALRHGDKGMKRREIDRIVQRYVEGASQSSSPEGSNEARGRDRAEPVTAATSGR